MTALVAPTVFDVGMLAMQMRADEIAQWCALTGQAEYDPDAAARAILSTMGPLAFCLIDADRQPIVAGGLKLLRPGVYEGWMIGSDAGWARHWRTITKATRRLHDGVLADGAHRIQLVTGANRVATHEWYERGLRMRREGRLRGYCADGSDAVMFARTGEGA